MRRWSISLSALLLSGFTASVMAQVSLADCDADDFATTLSPASGNPAATAVWIDGSRLIWPGQTAGRYRLYHAASGQMKATVGQEVLGADAVLELRQDDEPLDDLEAVAFAYLGEGERLRLTNGTLAEHVDWMQGQTLLVREDATGRVEAAAALQSGALLDALFGEQAAKASLGAAPGVDETGFALWAPTARRVDVCVFPGPQEAAAERLAMQPDPSSGVWRTGQEGDLHGRYYRYLVEVYVPGTGWVLNRVTDPYSVSLSADSRRSQVLDLKRADTLPEGWQDAPRPSPAEHAVDAVLYELHVRDFSVADSSVPEADRGNYAAFGHPDSDGMRHLRALADAGITDLHLMPVFDIASIPEIGCVTPAIPQGDDPEALQTAIAEVAARDCYNWGYDPLHYGAPEGSYASDAMHGEVRVRELRAAIQALHGIGLRVGMDVVYNHTPASGQALHSVLDRIVPGYYQRLSPVGEVERSTCCANTAIEQRMMARLMRDSVATWAREYHIDSFRFDLMGHQPRAAMEAVQAAADEARGRHVVLLGEGWNFGEVADGARFVQASQRSLAGSGIATFSDRARDAVRGGGCCDSGVDLLARQGYVNGLDYAPNAMAEGRATRADLLRAADLVRVGLAGTLADYTMQTAGGAILPLAGIDYAGQPAGYASEPGEVVNYVENHDNPTLFDINVLKLPPSTPAAERARVQILAAAIPMFSQGIAYFHAGIEGLRSKSLDRNSYDSGDWFNRIDWSFRDNGFGSGLPPAADNGADWPLLRPLLADPALKPSAKLIQWTRDVFFDLLRLRESSSLFRLRSADEVRRRLHFLNTGPDQVATLLVAHLDGRELPDARYAELMFFINVDPRAADYAVDAERGKAWQLHPVQRRADAADARVREQAVFDAKHERFHVPARSAVVFVIE